MCNSWCTLRKSQIVKIGTAATIFYLEGLFGERQGIMLLLLETLKKSSKSQIRQHLK